MSELCDVLQHISDSKGSNDFNLQKPVSRRSYDKDPPGGHVLAVPDLLHSGKYTTRVAYQLDCRKYLKAKYQRT